VFGEVCQGVPVLVIGFRDGTQRPHEVGDRARDRTGGDDLADGFASPLDDEFFPTVPHPVKQIGELTNGLGRRKVKFHKICLSKYKQSMKIGFCFGSVYGGWEVSWEQ